MAEVVLTQFVIDVLIIAGAFVVLNWASNIAINNAVKVATVTRFGKTAMGFSIIAFSTSLPELTVAFIAALSIGAANGQSAAPLSVGNVLGSNIVNICVIIGLATFILHFRQMRKPKGSSGSNGINVIPSFAKSELSSIYFGLFISSVIPIILIYISAATWIVGLVLLFIFVGYMYQLSKVRIPEENSEVVSQDEKSRLKRYFFFTLLGALAL